LPIGGIPLPLQLGYKTDSSGQGNWVDQLDSYMQSQSTQKDSYTTSVETANAGVVTAWEDCMANKKGLIVSPDGNEQDVIISVQFIPPTPTEVSPTLLKPDFNPEEVQLLTPESNFVGQVAPYVQPLPIRFRRVNGYRGDITFAWFTSNPQYSAKLRLRGIPEQAPPPPPRDFTLEDFDGDRLRDSHALSAHGFTVTLGNGRTEGLWRPLHRQTSIPTMVIGLWGILMETGTAT
jgi:hypothetical protein